MTLARLFSAALACTVGALAPASPAAEMAVPSPSLQNDGGIPIVSQADASAALVGVVLVLHAGLDRQSLRENGLAALVAQTILRTPVKQSESPAIPLEDAIAARGGSIRFTVDPSDVRFYVEALAGNASAAVALFQSALTAPDFSPATVRSAREALGRRIAQNQQLALQVGLDMLDQASATQANAGLPELGTTTSLAQLVPGDARAFYATYYRRGGALVSAAGNLGALAPGALAALAGALPAGETSAVHVHVPQLTGTTREIVTHRDINSPWLIAQYPGPNVNSRDFGPMLVLAAFVRRTLSDIAQVPGVVSPTFASRSVGAVYDYDRAPASLLLYVNGGLIGDPSRAFATALSVVNVLAATRLQGSIEDFKAEATGDFAGSAATLETRAWLAAVFARQSSSPDFVNRGLAAIAATTPEDVQRVARTYLGNPTIALVLPRGTNLQD